MRINVKQTISSNSNGRFSYTTDIWTSNQNLGYICLTVHFIDENFNLHNFVIGFEVIPCPHSGVNIADAIFNISSEYGCFHRSMCLVADNASNNSAAVDQLHVKVLHNVRSSIFSTYIVINVILNTEHPTFP